MVGVADVVVVIVVIIVVVVVVVVVVIVVVVVVAAVVGDESSLMHRTRARLNVTGLFGCSSIFPFTSSKVQMDSPFPCPGYSFAALHFRL